MKNKEFKSMSEIEVTIQKIDDAKMIYVYELTGARLKKDIKGCAAIAIAYGENEQINLSENDEGFQMLVNKAYQIYKDNKDLIMDETTRKLLESGASFGMEQTVKSFYKMDAVELPVILGDALLSERFLPIIEYLVNGCYELFDLDAQIVKREAGWRGACLLEADVDGKDIIHYARVSKINDRHYAISITNCLKENATMLVNVRIGFGNMEISFHSDALNLSGEFIYDFKDDKLTERKEVIYENKTIYYDSKDHEMQDQCYMLPFQVEYRITKEQSQTEDVESSAICGQYVWMNGNFVEMTGWTEVLNTKKNIRLKLHSLHMQQILLEDGRWQTYFLETDGSTSEKYRKNLQGRYFIQ